MSTHTPSKHWLLAIIPMSVAFTAIAWSGRLSGNNYNDYQLHDSLPAAKAAPAAKAKPAVKKAPKAKPFAKEIKELDEATKDINTQVIKDIDVKKIQEEINRSINEATREIANTEEIDPKEVERDVEAATKEINEEKVRLEVEEEIKGIKNIDYQKIQQQIEESLKQVNQYLNSDEFKNSLRAASKPNLEHISAELKKTKRELDKNKINITIDMEKARAGIEKAKNELKGYQEMIDRMEKDGLVNNNEDYTIEYKNGALYINDQEQPESVSRKYNSYFKEEGTKISRKNGSFKISME